MTELQYRLASECNHAFSFHGPAMSDLIPLVVDSPHSCPVMPEGAGCVAPEQALTSGTDIFVDELWSAVPEVGGQLLCAAFHRSFIDANRHPLDIDEEMLTSAWPTQTQASEKTRRGMGLVRRYALPGVPMYNRRLTVQEVQHRLRAFYLPYHDRLDAALELACRQFEQVWHINCHSMKSVGNAMNEDDGVPRPDLVISDAEGTTADPGHTAWVAGWWREMGYRVNVNDPYKGGLIIRRVGRPAQHCHSIQIEINRKLYLNEQTFQKTEGFDLLASHIGNFLIELRVHIFKKLLSTGSAKQWA